MANENILNVNSNRKGKRGGLKVLGLLLVCLSMSIYVSFQQTQSFIQRHTAREVRDNEHAQLLPVRRVGAQPLKHEQAFQDTIKSCLPEKNKKCKLYIPENTTAERIAVMAPEGDLGSEFVKLVKAVARNAKIKHGIELDIIPTTHIPPYGYGKTHGLTRIIRVVPQPLLVSTINSLRYAIDGNSDSDQITIEDIKASLRLQMRYHCRLSHIAAHTALWSINLEALADMSTEDLVEETQIFLGIPTDNFLDEKTDDSSDMLEPMEGSFLHMAHDAAAVLTHTQIDISQSILKELDETLLNELIISRNLTAWPCESFWTVGSTPQGEIFPLVSKIASAMSPDCEAPLSSCWVKKDKCEAKHNGRC